jgi:hypothetical protein
MIDMGLKVQLTLSAAMTGEIFEADVELFSQLRFSWLAYLLPVTSSVSASVASQA